MINISVINVFGDIRENFLTESLIKEIQKELFLATLKSQLLEQFILELVN